MSAPLATSASDCCSPCPDIPITQVPGPQGPAGTDGTDGTDGVNAFTATTALFVQPAVNANVTVTVADTAWMSVGQVLFIENGGHYKVSNVLTATSVSLENLGYPGNVAPATNVVSGQSVSPAGLRGPTGASPATPTLNDLSPTTTKGDIIVDNGANSPAAGDVRLAAGTDGQQLTALAAQPTGLVYRTITPNAATDNVVPRFDASGATTPTPLQSSGVQITDTAAVQTTAGNARGTSAVDLQPVRAVATQVASGNNSAIGGGQNNTASAANSSVGGGSTNVASAASASVAGGIRNTATGIESHVGGGADNAAGGADSVVAGGSGNIATGVGSFIGGGSSNEVQGIDASILGGTGNFSSSDYSAVVGRNNASTGIYSAVPGGLFATAYLYGQVAHASGRFSATGDAQTSELIWRGATTDATPTEIFLDGSGTRAVIPNNTTWAFSILVAARRDDGTSAILKVEGGLKNTGGTVVLVAAITTTVVSDGSGGAIVAGSFVASADDPNNALKIVFTGVAAQNWRVVAHGRLVEVLF